ncbi:MAG: hypothetical protein M5U34_34735 [Chloroflexi bacterium]|nr:hypothetical protein [Chloroflexota bacterium]
MAAGAATGWRQVGINDASTSGIPAMHGRNFNGRYRIIWYAVNGGMQALFFYTAARSGDWPPGEWRPLV